MKKLLIMALITISMAVIAAPLQAQSKKAEKKAQQAEAYNKALKAIEDRNFIFQFETLGGKPIVNKKESFILIQGDKGVFQSTLYSGTGLRPITDVKIREKRNGDILFECLIASYYDSKAPLYITLRHGTNIGIANFLQHQNIMGRILPENEAKYFIYRNLRYNE